MFVKLISAWYLGMCAAFACSINVFCVDDTGSWTTWAFGTGWAEFHATMNLHSLWLLLPKYHLRHQLLTCQGEFSAFQPLLLDAAWCICIVTNLAWGNQDQGATSVQMIVGWSDNEGMCPSFKYLPTGSSFDCCCIKTYRCQKKEAACRGRATANYTFSSL